MRISTRNILDLFLWFQTLSLLTEAYQEGMIDRAVSAVNAGFILVFMVYAWRGLGRAALPLAFLSFFLVAQLLLPASLSLVIGGTGILFNELIKLTAWLVIMLFSISVHTDKEKIEATLRTLHRCAFFLLAMIVLFQVLHLRETAYGMGIIYMGGIKNEPSVSMFSLAFLATFITSMPKRRQYVGIVGLLTVILLVMKRSSLLVGILITILGLKYVLPMGHIFRIVVYVSLVLFVVNFLIYLDLTNFLYSSDLVSQRFKDLQKLQQSSDLGYLGSGRLGLLQDHFEAFQARDGVQKLFGLTILSANEATAGGYLGQGLHAAAHNDFMEILTRGGYFGLFTYVALLITVTAKLTWLSGRPDDPYLQAVAFTGRIAALAYLLHISIGVIFKVQFMSVIVILVGISMRIGYVARNSRKSTPGNKQA